LKLTTRSPKRAVLGFTIFWYEWDWLAAEAHYRRGLELDPRSVDLRYHYAHLLSNLGQHEKALSVIKLARDLDPLNFTINAVEGQMLFFAGKLDEALEQLNDTIDLNPNFWLTHLFISRVYSQKGLHAEAIALVGYELAKSGDTEKALSVLEELRELAKTRYVPPYNLALVFNGLGDSEKALDYLEQGFAEKAALMVFLKVEPKWNNLRNEPHFIDLMKRMKLR
jgi:tetratricopeptide (TPR) repeat protein